jgi:ribosome biogenesis GTPase
MILEGRIIKGIGGFYYVDAARTLYECRARGLFRKQGRTPLVGDIVDIEPIQEKEGTAYLVDIHERKSCLVRPAVANADQVVLIFSVSNPSPRRELIDRFLVNMEMQDIETILCISKMDLEGETDAVERLRNVYEKAGYHTHAISNKTGEGIEELKDMLHGKTTVLSGPSGVGKSSLINSITQEYRMEVGGISEKIGRGKNTTRHAEIIPLDDESYIIDTPGYSSLDIMCKEAGELQHYMREFEGFIGGCRFAGCAHISEPDCSIKQAVADGQISEERYKSYAGIYEEIKSRRRY